MRCNRQIVRRVFRLGGAFTLVLAGSVIAWSAAAADPTARPASSEQATALAVLDNVIARFDGLLAKDDDARHQAATTTKLDEFKERRDALRAEFDQTRYDELRIDLNLEFQRLASWMAPPRLAPPGKGK